MALQIPGLPEWLIQNNLRDLVINLFQRQAIRKGAFTTQDTELYQAALRKPGAIVAAMNYYRQFLSGQFWGRHWGRLANPVTAPTLVLWGEEDTLFKSGGN